MLPLQTCLLRMLHSLERGQPRQSILAQGGWPLISKLHQIREIRGPMNDGALVVRGASLLVVYQPSEPSSSCFLLLLATLSLIVTFTICCVCIKCKVKATGEIPATTSPRRSKEIPKSPLKLETSYIQLPSGSVISVRQVTPRRISVEHRK